MIPAPISNVYAARLQAFRNSNFPRNAMNNCINTWLIFVEKLIYCYIDDTPHFRNWNTCRLEEMHRCLEDYIQTYAG